MYESHFAMSSRPFKAAPDISRFFPASTIEDARERVVQCIERGDGPALVIGPPGTGKTLLLSVLSEWFDNRFAMAFLGSAQLCTRRALLQMILHALDLPYRELGEGELRLSLIDRLQSPDDTTEGLLLLVDEAQSIPTKLLEELRMLTNLVRDGVPRARVVLAGTPAFEERLVQPQLATFQQRVSARCYLMPFDRNETWQYIAAQLSASGTTPNQLFDEETIDRIYAATDGVPRLVNQLCDHALLLAMADGAERITSNLADEAWADLQQLPAPSRIETHDAVDGEPIIEFGSLDEFESTADGDLDRDRADGLETVDSPAIMESESTCEPEPILGVDADFDLREPHDLKELSLCEVDPAPSADAVIDPVEQIAAICRALPSVESGGETDEESNLVNPFGAKFEDEEIVVKGSSAALQTEAIQTDCEFVCFPLAAAAEQPATPGGVPSSPASEEVADPLNAEDLEPSPPEPAPLQPVPLFVQPDIDGQADPDPVYPPEELHEEEPVATTLRLDIVDALSDAADAIELQTDDCSELELPQPVSEPEATGICSVEADRPRFGRLFSSLRQG